MNRVVPQGTYEEMPTVLTERDSGLCTGLSLPVPADVEHDDHLTELIERCKAITTLRELSRNGLRQIIHFFIDHDAPAGQPDRQAHIVALRADRPGELSTRQHDVCRTNGSACREGSHAAPPNRCSQRGSSTSCRPQSNPFSVKHLGVASLGASSGCSGCSPWVQPNTAKDPPWLPVSRRSIWVTA